MCVWFAFFYFTYVFSKSMLLFLYYSENLVSVIPTVGNLLSVFVCAIINFVNLPYFVCFIYHKIILMYSKVSH